MSRSAQGSLKVICTLQYAAGSSAPRSLWLLGNGQGESGGRGGGGGHAFTERLWRLVCVWCSVSASMSGRSRASRAESEPLQCRRMVPSGARTIMLMRARSLVKSSTFSTWKAACMHAHAQQPGSGCERHGGKHHFLADKAQHIQRLSGNLRASLCLMQQCTMEESLHAAAGSDARGRGPLLRAWRVLGIEWMRTLSPSMRTVIEVRSLATNSKPSWRPPSTSATSSGEGP